VVLPIDQYEEFLGDMGDLAAIAERLKEPATPFEELREKRQKGGIKTMVR
jgi:hypothetical protein